MFEVLVIFLTVLFSFTISPLLLHVWNKVYTRFFKNTKRQMMGIIVATSFAVIFFGLIFWITCMSNQVENKRHTEVIDEIYKSTETVLNAIHNE